MKRVLLIILSLLAHRDKSYSQDWRIVTESEYKRLQSIGSDFLFKTYQDKQNTYYYWVAKNIVKTQSKMGVEPKIEQGDIKIQIYGHLSTNLHFPQKSAGDTFVFKEELAAQLALDCKYDKIPSKVSIIAKDDRYSVITDNEKTYFIYREEAILIGYTLFIPKKYYTEHLELKVRFTSLNAEYELDGFEITVYTP